MPLFTFTGLRAQEYTKPAFVAEPGKDYELDEAPDALYWKPARKTSGKPNDPTNERK